MDELKSDQADYLIPTPPTYYKYIREFISKSGHLKKNLSQNFTNIGRQMHCQ